MDGNLHAPQAFSFFIFFCFKAMLLVVVHWGNWIIWGLFVPVVCTRDQRWWTSPHKLSKRRCGLLWLERHLC